MEDGNVISISLLLSMSNISTKMTLDTKALSN